MKESLLNPSADQWTSMSFLFSTISIAWNLDPFDFENLESRLPTRISERSPFELRSKIIDQSPRVSDRRLSYWKHFFFRNATTLRVLFGDLLQLRSLIYVEKLNLQSNFLEFDKLFFFLQARTPQDPMASSCGRTSWKSVCFYGSRFCRTSILRRPLPICQTCSWLS